jgi:hypothetical protein
MMSDKRQQATAAGWVSATPVAIESAQAQQRNNAPTFRGATDGLKITVFFALAVIIGGAVGYLVFLVASVQVAVAVFVLTVLVVFVPLFVFTLLTESGYLHRKSEESVELAKIDLATIQSMSINEAQDASIRQLQVDVTNIKKQIAGLRTIEIHDRESSRTVSLRDDVDAAIDVWLAQTMFDTAGRLVGVHPSSGVLRVPYPYKGTDENSRQAHSRLTGAGLIVMRQKGNQYAWIGPVTLNETLDALAPLRDDED